MDGGMTGSEPLSPTETIDADEITRLLVDRLESEARDRVSKRNIVEQRWIEDIQQYEGAYDSTYISRLEAEGRSTAFINETRPKTLACESKLFDMLFPTDDRNWGIKPTPVPNLALDAKRAIENAEQLTAEANVTEDPEQAQALIGQANVEADKAAQAEMVMREAKDRAELMTDEIDDHLVECGWQDECRDIIHDTCLLGTGIMKGPLPRTERTRRNWLKKDNGVYELQFREGTDRLVFQRVSPWNLFPSSTAMHFGDSEDWYERHIMRARDLRRFANLPNVNVGEIEKLLEEGPQEEVPTYVDQMQSISSENMEADRKRWIMWEYRGTLDFDEMKALCRIHGIDAEQAEKVSRLFAVDCTVWFCQGRIIKFGFNHMDSNASIYSFFLLEKNEARLWGVGIPWIMRQPQAVINAAWRIMLDNAAIASFPQTVVDTGVIEPVEGDDYGIRARKTWLRREGADPNKPGIAFEEIPMRQPELAAIIELCKGFIDTETSISVLAQGEQGATTKTASGMALLFNSVNVIFRRIVRNWDDGITKPSLERAYDYLMQFSKREEIKGDYQVQARGSSVLLVREIQAQNLMILALQATQHPVLGKYFRERDLLKKLVQSMMIDSGDVLKSEKEIEEEEALEAQQGMPDPELLKLELEGQIAEMNATTELQIAQLRHEEAMMKLATDRDIRLEDIAARLQGVREQVAGRLDAIREQSAARFATAREDNAGRLAATREQGASKERIFAGEVAVEALKPPDAEGSGGYV